MKSEGNHQRSMGLMGATGVGIGAIVGGGILALAGVAFANAGPSAILAFGLNGVIAMLTAVTFAEMASRFPESGGTYTFAKKVLSVEAAFMVGWIVWFASIAAAVLYAIGFAFFAMVMVTDLWDAMIGDAPAWLNHSSTLAVVAIVTTALTTLGLIQNSSGDGSWVNICKVGVFILLIACGLWAAVRQPLDITTSSLQPFFQSGFSGLVQAMGYTFIALQGFDLIAAVGGEVRDPGKNLPRAIILSLTIAIAIYLPLLFVITAVGTPDGQSIGQAAAENPEGIVAVAATKFLGSFGYWLVVVAAVLSMYSALQANLFAASRIAMTMAIDRTLPASLALLRGENKAPVTSIVATSVLVTTILLVLPNVSAAGAAASLIFLITFALTHWLVFLARRRSSRPAPFRSPLFPLVPVVGGLACVALAIFQGIAVPLAGIVTIVWLGIGGVLFLSLFSHRARVMDVSSTAFNPELNKLRGRAPLVLVPVSNPQNVRAMMSLADALVPAGVGRVLMQTVAVVPPEWNPDENPQPIEALQVVVSELLKASAKLGIKVETIATASPNPMQEIARVARLHRCESVLLGLTEISKSNNGSHLESLLGTLDANVIVLRARNDWQLSAVKAILVPIAGRGKHDRVRAQLLGSLLRNSKRELTFLRILPNKATAEEIRAAKRDLHRLAADEVRESCNVVVLQSDDPSQSIIESTVDFDLVIVGAQRLGRREKLFGNFTRKLASQTSCPIIVMSRRG